MSTWRDPKKSDMTHAYFWMFRGGIKLVIKRNGTGSSQEKSSPSVVLFDEKQP